MMRGAVTILALVSVILFPWPVTVLIALGGSLAEPLLPLAAGIFADTLYYTHAAGTLPWGTLAGALATLVAFFVRSRLKPSIIGG